MYMLFCIVKPVWLHESLALCLIDRLIDYLAIIYM